MGRRTRYHLAASRVHKWLALILGAQLLIWFASGALMSFLPIDKVRGEHLVGRHPRRGRPRRRNRQKGRGAGPGVNGPPTFLQ
mgnify:CR=1 FL=1